jgi:hypothetical protein
MITASTPFALSDFTAEMFRPLQGSKVRFVRPTPQGAAHETVDLTLVAVQESDGSPRPGFRRPFSLLFTSQDQAPLQDRFLHQLSHPDFEACVLLLSRVSVPDLDPRDGTIFYELVFA